MTCWDLRSTSPTLEYSCQCSCERTMQIQIGLAMLARIRICMKPSRPHIYVNVMIITPPDLYPRLCPCRRSQPNATVHECHCIVREHVLIPSRSHLEAEAFIFRASQSPSMPSRRCIHVS